ncbi:MAG: divalent-cation tolerance protein CutA [Aquificae bacterium]|nr:divalent-cation tolerance protein CutA [Aquificota bacterium]
MEVKYCVVFITAPVEEAPKIARFLVEKKLAACVNAVEEVRSLYWWEGKIEDDKEGLLIVKTRLDLFEKLKEEVKKVHPYCVPEIIALPIVAGNEEYLKWVDETVSSEGG